MDCSAKPVSSSLPTTAIVGVCRDGQNFLRDDVSGRWSDCNEAAQLLRVKRQEWQGVTATHGGRHYYRLLQPQ
ncbi:hypothetical protein B566_EDAN012913 [Ephemera danica]|nr:hypothetical protein B566_EDAN012913 [Ephemera danica]